MGVEQQLGSSLDIYQVGKMGNKHSVTSRLNDSKKKCRYHACNDCRPSKRPEPIKPEIPLFENQQAQQNNEGAKHINNQQEKQADNDQNPDQQRATESEDKEEEGDEEEDQQEIQDKAEDIAEDIA